MTAARNIIPAPSGANTAYVYVTSGNAQIEYLKKGDLVGKDTHIAIVHSEGVVNNEYDIIHANGNEEYDDDGDLATPSIFSRKVMVTGNDAFNPTRYGRLTLWD